MTMMDRMSVVTVTLSRRERRQIVTRCIGAEAALGVGGLVGPAVMAGRPCIPRRAP